MKLLEEKFAVLYEQNFGTGQEREQEPSLTILGVAPEQKGEQRN